jgi:hypothetical protein
MLEEHDTLITQEDKLAVYALIQETVGRGQPVSGMAIAQLMPLLVKLTHLIAPRLEEFNSVCAAEKALRVVCDEAIAKVERLKSRVAELEKNLAEKNNSLGLLRVKYTLTDSFLPDDFEPELEPLDRLTQYFTQSDPEATGGGN